jgi:acyl-CoA synthetase (NDP forming)
MWGRIHPDDRERLWEEVQEALREQRDFFEEFRILLPDGRVKYLEANTHHEFSPLGELIEVICTNVDVTERKRAQDEHERLRQLEADLAHINRVSTMGELAASLSHEILHPIATARNNARAGMRFLEMNPPNLGEVREALGCVVRDADRARDIVHAFLAGQPDGGWLPRQDVAGLMRAYRIPLAASAVVRSAGTDMDTGTAADDAATAAALAGYPVVRVGVRDDQMFGPLVVFGLGGVATEVLADHAARLVPLTEADADMLINSIRSAPLLHGHRGSAAADIPALRDVLMRVSRLADDLPEVTELDLNPVIARQLGAVTVDARIRVTPQVPQDPFLRRLRLTCRPRSRPD